MSNPIQPRPCTLWGQKFESIHVTSFGVRAIDDFDIYPASRMFQARITLGDEARLYSPNRYEMRIDAHYDMHKAITTIHNALYPPLCMKHALEVGYGFEVGAEYKTDCGARTYTKLEWGKAFKCLCDESHLTIEDIDWFYPVNHLGQPIHGDAEAVVKRYEEGA